MSLNTVITHAHYCFDSALRLPQPPQKRPTKRRQKAKRATTRAATRKRRKSRREQGVKQRLRASSRMSTHQLLLIIQTRVRSMIFLVWNSCLQWTRRSGSTGFVLDVCFCVRVSHFLLTSCSASLRIVCMRAYVLAKSIQRT